MEFSLISQVVAGKGKKNTSRYLSLQINVLFCAGRGKIPGIKKKKQHIYKSSSHNTTIVAKGDIMNKQLILSILMVVSLLAVLP
ncbi:MAG: hypothetical protein PHW58_07810, partial [Candidatus Methanofastidiosa archaeon]|nr:hypothetical protein [Candidatus Methanofastidiosa archaeon]